MIGRQVARIFIRGPDARQIRSDLEEIFARDLERGVPRGRARLRYVGNLLGSAASTWRARVGGAGPPGVSWLDFKLGVRMLRRYPGLTVVGGLAMAYAIAVGAGAFEAVRQLVDPTLPLPDGERIVALQNRDVTTGGIDARALHDFETWRAELEAVESLGAWRDVARNLVLDGDVVGPVQVAEMSASGFRIAGVRPLLGRVLDAADEQPGAPPMVVIGHDFWQARFGGAADMVGRTIGLGTTQATVVGVMPEGFGFPVSHGLWMPLRLRALEYERGASPAVSIIGRLAEGATLERAQAELTALGRRAAAVHRETHEHLRPEVLPFAASIVSLDVPPEYRRVFYAVNLVFVMLLLLICANVALLMYARTATRASEIVVRNALGATRGRIVMQLFVEALVLGSLAAAAGLVAARMTLRAWLRVGEIEWAGLPFWFHDRIAPLTVVYAVALAVLGAAVAGMVPALRMTGRAGERRLRQLAAGSGSPGFGAAWTLVIILQVAITVAFPATAFFARRYVVQAQSADLGFASHEYLSARLELDTDASGRGMEATWAELERRLEAEPGVGSVTYADRLPRTHHPSRPVEVEGVSEAAVRVGSAAVAPDYFDVLGVEILAGRAFRDADAAPDAAAAIVVNHSFVERVLGGRNAVGRRIRRAVREDSEPGPWQEIIGVVPDMGMLDDPSGGAGFYRAARPGDVAALHVVVQTRGTPGAFVAHLREAGAAVDPALRLHDVLPLDAVGATMWAETAFLFRLLVAVSAIALVLALAGIFAVTSFAVSRRSREIGIRVALGAEPRRVVAAIFARPVAHVSVGVLIGGALTALQASAFALDPLGPAGIALVVAYAVCMLAVCLLACGVPTWRALRVEPGVVLKAEP